MPTILILTANDPSDHLHQLAAEGKEIQRILNSAHGKAFDVVLVPECSTEDLIRELMVPNREIEIVHYAGHAGSSSLRLTDTDAEAAALAEKLRSQGTVKLVFLNGCATRGQVEFFHAAGVPFVFATSRPVGDNKAYWVATQFYQYLTLGRSLKAASDEVVTDAQKLSKKVHEFRKERGVAFRADVGPDDALEWDLYPRPGSEAADYGLPFNRPPQRFVEGVNHTAFLDDLIFALEPVDAPVLASVKKLAGHIRDGQVPNNKKIAELLRVLPYTLGVRLRQINADPSERGNDYYRELLYDYAFFFETLLQHTVALLCAQIWQHKDRLQGTEPSEFQALRRYLTGNHLAEAPGAYIQLLEELLAGMQKAGIRNVLPLEKAPIDYLRSERFQAAADFFFLQKKYYWQRVRLKDEEALENCFLAQGFLSEAFRPFGFIVRYLLASIRGINVRNFRHLPVVYHNIVSKLILTEAEPDPKPGASMMENKSVLCFDTADFEPDTPSLNLFPFIIDRNVFTGKPNDEVDLYLFAGYFAPEGSEKPCYHYTSVQNPGKIWRFDETQNHVSLLHVGESSLMVHEVNHLMAGTGEFRNYLQEFRKHFIPA